MGSCRRPLLLRLSDADISPVTPTLNRRQPSAPPSRAKTQIPQHDSTLPTAPRPTKIAFAPRTRPASLFESEEATQSLALNPHRLTPPQARTPAALSSFEAFRTPASVHPRAPVSGRHPKTLNVSGHLDTRDRPGRVDRKLPFVARETWPARPKPYALMTRQQSKFKLNGNVLKTCVWGKNRRRRIKITVYPKWPSAGSCADP
jgi:hypothetical protein